MKKFLFNLLIISAIFITLILLLVLGRIWTTHSMSWKIASEKHILFLGASHIAHGIDDKLMHSAFNFAKDSERYMFTYIKLQHLLQENSQIDTIFLQCAPSDLWEHADYKYHTINEQVGYVPLYWPLFNFEQWHIYKEEPSQVLGIIASKLCSQTFFVKNRYWKALGGHKNEADNSKEMNRSKVKPKLVEGTRGQNTNYYYLHKIVDLCRNNNIKLYFLYCPVFRPEYYYDHSYFYKAYKENFSEIELLDYSHWEMEDHERFDAHHLNRKGAQKFTEELKRRFNIK